MAIQRQVEWVPVQVVASDDVFDRAIPVMESRWALTDGSITADATAIKALTDIDHVGGSRQGYLLLPVSIAMACGEAVAKQESAVDRNEYGNPAENLLTVGDVLTAFDASSNLAPAPPPAQQSDAPDRGVDAGVSLSSNKKSRIASNVK